MINRLSQLAFAAIVISFGLTVFFSTSTNALSGSDWQPGHIIDNSLFYDGSAMSVDEIQYFLNTQVSSCDTWGTKPHWSGGTRADYGRSQGVAPPYICLKDYYENPTTHATNFNPTASIPAGSISAAQIIWSAAHDFNVSPKALLATLQKEAADNLIGDDWPWPTQYRSAMGYGCPDTAPCDAEYYGFYNQMYNAARQFRRYANYPQEYRYKSGNTIFIQYNPNASCSGTNVFIQNQATASLYNYTPYQPNQAALNNLYGTGDGCSAYGNRNFWRIYNDWFGSTYGSLWRTADNATLYYVDDGRKYAVPSIKIMDNYGFTANDVRFVTQAQMNSVPNATAPFTSVLGQLVKSESDSDADGGTVYLVDAGRKIPIGSMEQLTNFGFTSANIHYIAYTALQRLPSDPTLSNFVQDGNQTMYQMELGKKRVFFELSKYAQTNTTGKFTRLSNITMDSWPYGTPQIDGSYLVTGPDGTIRLYNGSTYHILTSMDTYDCWGFSGLRAYRLNNYSIVGGSSNGSLRCIAKGSSSTNYVVNGNSKLPLTSGANLTPSTVPDDVLNRLATGSTPTVIKNNVGELSVLENNIRRAIPTMDVYAKLGYTGNSAVTLKKGAYSAFTSGPFKLAVSSLVLDSSGTVSVVTSNTGRLIINSADAFNAYNFNWGSLINVSSSTLGAYPSGGVLQTQIKSSGTVYIIDQGKKYTVNSEQQTNFGLNAGDLPEMPAALLSGLESSQIVEFVKSSDNGTIYHVQNGQKHPIASWDAFIRLAGSSNNFVTLNYLNLNRLPTGSVVN